MNMQNIIALSETVQLLGFADEAVQLFKRISFKPSQFEIKQQKIIEDGAVDFKLYFEKDSRLESYFLLYYDANLLREIAVNNLDASDDLVVKELQQRMAAIDWNDAFSFDKHMAKDINDNTLRHQQEQVELVIETLLALEKTEAGKQIAIVLKHRHWGSLNFPEGYPMLGILKRKAEISQRFYCSNNRVGITVDEAIRFLNNKWLEKALLTKRRLNTNKKEVKVENGQIGSTAKLEKSSRNTKTLKKINA